MRVCLWKRILCGCGFVCGNGLYRLLACPSAAGVMAVCLREPAAAISAQGLFVEAGFVQVWVLCVENGFRRLLACPPVAGYVAGLFAETACSCRWCAGSGCGLAGSAARCARFFIRMHSSRICPHPSLRQWINVIQSIIALCQRMS